MANGDFSLHRRQNPQNHRRRADIDGLPIQEEVVSAFQSKRPGFMHACGHDFHMTIGLGILKELSQQQPDNNFLFLFQPAEENEAGEC